MGRILWDEDKNVRLKRERGISFEEIVVCIENRQVLAIIQNPSRKYSGQEVFVIGLGGYIFYVPFVKYGGDIFLKTIIPSRKLTKKYLKKAGEENE